MTLAEVVIAIAIISFSIPLILAATGEAHRSRQASEVDTRSTWLVRDVQRRITHMWSENTLLYGLKHPFPFPSADSPNVTIELRYKQDGTLIADDREQAVYLVSVQAEAYNQKPDHFPRSSLALVTIKIQHPAKSTSNKRTKLTYQFLSTRVGII
jgi:hypothetical protein